MIGTMDRNEWTKILKELDELCELHEKGAADPGKCREFNSRASLFLNRLEEQECIRYSGPGHGSIGRLQPKGFLSLRQPPVHQRLSRAAPDKGQREDGKKLNKSERDCSSSFSL